MKEGITKQNKNFNKEKEKAIRSMSIVLLEKFLPGAGLWIIHVETQKNVLVKSFSNGDSKV